MGYRFPVSSYSNLNFIIFLLSSVGRAGGTNYTGAIPIKADKKRSLKLYKFHIFLLSSVGRANISLCTHELVWETHKFGTDFCAVPPHSSLAQSVEHLTVNQGVTGSSPVGGAI